MNRNTAVDTTGARATYRAPLVLSVCVFLQGLCLTWAFLAMRAVMNVGGACADGGPYVSAQPCPDGAVLIAVAVPVLLISAMVGTLAAVPLNAPNLLLPMWGILFCSLGWNFLEFAFAPSDGIVWGWLVCGVLFQAMGLPAIWAIFLGVREMVAPSRDRMKPSSVWWVPAYALLGAVGLVAGWWSFYAIG